MQIWDPHWSLCKSYFLFPMSRGPSSCGLQRLVSKRDTDLPEAIGTPEITGAAQHMLRMLEGPRPFQESWGSTGAH